MDSRLIQTVAGEITEGVSRQGMDLQRFVEVTSTNAAKVMGLYPRKGVLAPGSDADICIIDPDIRRKLTAEDFHISDYSIWGGIPDRGVARDDHPARGGGGVERRLRRGCLRPADPPQDRLRGNRPAGVLTSGGR